MEPRHAPWNELYLDIVPLMLSRSIYVLLAERIYRFVIVSRCTVGVSRPFSYLESLFFQDNCLLECRMKKLSVECGCLPWYMNHGELPACGFKGNKCFDARLKAYRCAKNRIDETKTPW